MSTRGMGNLVPDSHTVRSTGDFLREWYGTQVFSAGFFMGSGVIADNGRNERNMITPDTTGVEYFFGRTDAEASYLVLRGNTNTQIQDWAGSTKPYLRMGISPKAFIPNDMFDALIYIDKVTPPDYDLR